MPALALILERVDRRLCISYRAATAPTGLPVPQSKGASSRGSRKTRKHILKDRHAEQTDDRCDGDNRPRVTVDVAAADAPAMVTAPFSIRHTPISDRPRLRSSDASAVVHSARRFGWRGYKPFTSTSVSLSHSINGLVGHRPAHDPPATDRPASPASPNANKPSTGRRPPHREPVFARARYEPRYNCVTNRKSPGQTPPTWRGETSEAGVPVARPVVKKLRSVRFARAARAVPSAQVAWSASGLSGWLTVSNHCGMVATGVTTSTGVVDNLGRRTITVSSHFVRDGAVRVCVVSLVPYGDVSSVGVGGCRTS
jgi:hypothetical protein